MGYLAALMDLTKPQDRARWARAFAVLTLLGATLGAALDGIHTHFGATTYTRPVVWRMAWWVPLLFAGAFTIGLLRPFLDRRLDGRLKTRTPAPRFAVVALAMGLFVVAYFLSVLPLSWPLVSVILTAVFVVGYWICDRSVVGLGIALGAAVGGPLFEGFLVDRGVFAHVEPAFFGVSGWLPFLYLTAAVGLTTLARWLVEAPGVTASLSTSARAH